MKMNMINFNEFSSIENYKFLIELLSSFNKDLVDLKKDGFEYTYNIDLRPYYQQELKKYIAKNEVKYKNLLFIQFQSKPFDKKESYYKEYLKFKNYSLKIEEIDNSIFFEWKKKFNDVFAFKELENLEINADQIYNNNFEIISRGLDIQKFGDFLDENNEIKSLTYFLDYKISQFIIDSFNSYCVANLLNNDSDPNPKFNIDEVALTRSTIKPISPSLKHSSLIMPKPHTKSSIEKSNKTKDKNGKLAEKMVRDKLLSSIPSLKWTSENSDVPSERNTSSSYDMEYIQDNQKHFIEVKAATEVFYMSLAEYNFARLNLKHYEIYLVDLENKLINGPHNIIEFEASKVSTEFKFAFESL